MLLAVSVAALWIVLGWAVVTRWLGLRPADWRTQLDQDSGWGALADSDIDRARWIYWSFAIIGYLSILLFWPAAIIRQRRKNRTNWF
ncbi:hypothetical protein [Streptomyces sp. NPDC056670]|uniref:hypothetical protein n=1 Tax=Streptomyces sp. NPDC056670 TaxID=3345904 RepID=UPI0036C3242F